MGKVEEQSGRATSDPAKRRDVLERVEREHVKFVHLWFTDLEGHLKSFSITPAELDEALDDGMGFDGS
ncbi:MAG: glutamine synthetase, partial [Actinobacteria bacterium]